jgi:hypothetical protein
MCFGHLRLDLWLNKLVFLAGFLAQKKKELISPGHLVIEIVT